MYSSGYSRRMRLKEKQPVIRECCDTCGLVVSGGSSVASLTGWIFGKGTCKCIVEVSDKTEPSSGETAENFTGTTVSDRYEVLSTIGTGGMGTVYKVRDKNLQTVFALKALRQEFGCNPEANKRFQREIEAIKRLDHPNLVSIYDSGRTQTGAPYLVMDYAEGENLANVLKSEGPMHPLRFIDLFTQILEALEHAHEKGVVHRDLKPSNIIVTKTESGAEIVKLVDFGIAKLSLHSNKTTQSVTRTGDIFGSPLYMSPEHCEGKRLDQRSDIYSLGCMMYECLTGHTPFSGENPVKTVLSHLYDAPSPMRRLTSLEVPSELEAVVMKCLNKDPADRYETARELLSEFKLIKEQKPPNVLKHADRRSRRKRLELTLRKYFPWTLVATCIVFILSVVPDLPYLFLLVDTGGAINRHTGADDFSKAILGRSDAYNLPYSYLCSAAVQGMAGNVDRSLDELGKSARIFNERSDANSALMADYFLIAMELNSGKTKDVSAHVKDAIKQIDKNSFDGPKKGMRLISFLYLPNLVSSRTEYATKLANDLARSKRSAEAEEVWSHILTNMPKKPGELFELNCAYEKYLLLVGKTAEAKQLREKLLKEKPWRQELIDECIRARDPQTAIPILVHDISTKELKSIYAREDMMRYLDRLRVCNSLAHLNNVDVDKGLARLTEKMESDDFSYLPYQNEGLPRLLFSERLDSELKQYYESTLAWLDSLKTSRIAVPPYYTAQIQQEYASYLFRMGSEYKEYRKEASSMRARALTNLSLVSSFNSTRALLRDIGHEALLSDDFAQAESCFLAMIKGDAAAGDTRLSEGSDLLRLAAVMVKQQRFKEANELYDRVLAVKKNHEAGGSAPYAMTAKAKVLLSLGDKGGALHWLLESEKDKRPRSVFESGIQEGTRYAMLAEIYLSDDKKKEAQAAVRRIEQIASGLTAWDQVRLLRKAANVYRKLQDEESATRCETMAKNKEAYARGSRTFKDIDDIYLNIALGDFDVAAGPWR